MLADRARASTYGTASRAVFWVALEQNGPWGRQAASQSHLEPRLGVALEQACGGVGGRLILIRRPINHPDSGRPSPRRCYVAWSGPGAWLLTSEVDSPQDLLGMDFAALARGDEVTVAASVPGLIRAEPVLLVCTNGRRDVCCAVRGRPVAAAGHTAYPGRVWECSHTGGHRYAPTGVLLPWGRMLAGLDHPAARDLLEAADDGRLPHELLGPRHDRGSSALAPVAQAAESAVRAAIGETDLGVLTALTTGAAADAPSHSADHETVAVQHADGRSWLVDLDRDEGAARPDSCGKAWSPSWTWLTTIRAHA